jgi:hypothetical protein
MSFFAAIQFIIVPNGHNIYNKMLGSLLFRTGTSRIGINMQDMRQIHCIGT